MRMTRAYLLFLLFVVGSSGLSLRRKKRESNPACGAGLVGNMLKSPNYPNNYPTNIDCTYEIHNKKGGSLELTFLDFNMEDSPNCAYDYVQIKDDDGESYGKYCGGLLRGKTMVVEGKRALITLHSDTSLTKRGFMLIAKSSQGAENGVEIAAEPTHSKPQTTTEELHPTTNEHVPTTVEPIPTTYDTEEPTEEHTDHPEYTTKIPPTEVEHTEEPPEVEPTTEFYETPSADSKTSELVEPTTEPEIPTTAQHPTHVEATSTKPHPKPATEHAPTSGEVFELTNEHVWTTAEAVRPTTAHHPTYDEATGTKPHPKPATEHAPTSGEVFEPTNEHVWTTAEAVRPTTAHHPTYDEATGTKPHPKPATEHAPTSGEVFEPTNEHVWTTAEAVHPTTEFTPTVIEGVEIGYTTPEAEPTTAKLEPTTEYIETGHEEEGSEPPAEEEFPVLVRSKDGKQSFDENVVTTIDPTTSETIPINESLAIPITNENAMTNPEGNESLATEEPTGKPLSTDNPLTSHAILTSEILPTEEPTGEELSTEVPPILSGKGRPKAHKNMMRDLELMALFNRMKYLFLQIQTMIFSDVVDEERDLLGLQEKRKRGIEDFMSDAEDTMGIKRYFGRRVRRDAEDDLFDELTRIENKRKHGRSS